MMATAIQYLFILLFVNPSFGQIKKVDAAPGTGNSGSSVPAENAVGGSRTEIPTLTEAQLQADNSRASQYIKSYEDFAKANASSPLVTAARAEVQIIRKCAVARSGSQYVIGSSRPMFCAGHPLSQYGGPQLPEGQRPLAAAADGFCTARPCSGVLAQNAQTILSAGHCTDGRSVENFCDEFVFVFNRTGGKTTFSSDEVFECDGGVSVDGTRTPNFNTHAADNVRDHAAFHLKRPVPATTAQPLSWRSTTSAIKPSESLYAVGHPQGAPRMISTLTQPHRLGGAVIVICRQRDMFTVAILEAHCWTAAVGWWEFWPLWMTTGMAFPVKENRWSYLPTGNQPAELRKQTALCRSKPLEQVRKLMRPFCKHKQLHDSKRHPYLPL